MLNRWRRGALYTIVLATVGLAGCNLEEKQIRDVYSWVEGVSSGVEKPEMGFRFPRQYCVPANTVGWKGKLTQTNPPPSGGALRFEKCLAAGTCVNIASYSMAIDPDGTIPSQTSTFSGACWDPGDFLNVYFTPFGGNVDAGAMLDFTFFYASDGGGDDTDRTLRVIAKRKGGATGKVLIDPPGPDSECLTPDPPSLKERLCIQSYDSTVPTVTLTAVPGEGYIFGEWQRDAAACGRNLTCEIPLEDGVVKTAVAVFMKP